MPPFKITLNPFNNQSSNWAPFHKKPGWEESVTWKTSCDKMIGTRRYHRTEKELVVNWLTVVQLLSHVQPLWPHRLKPARLLCPWDSPGKKTRVGCYFLFHPYMTTGKTIALTMWTLVSKVMSLFFYKKNFCFILDYIVDLQCCVSFQMCCKVIQLYTYLFFFKFFFYLGYYRILSSSLCYILYNSSLLIIY